MVGFSPVQTTSNLPSDLIFEMSIIASETQQIVDVDTELLPPGLSGHQWTHYKSGNTDLPWLPLKPVKYYTNAYVIINNKARRTYLER